MCTMAKHKVTIARSGWLCGEGGAQSYLHRPSDDTRCCLGFALEQHGMSRDDLTGIPSPDRLDNYSDIPQCLRWLVEYDRDLDGMEMSEDGVSLINLNDHEIGGRRDLETLREGEEPYVTSGADREAKIKEIFARHDIDVEFVW